MRKLYLKSLYSILYRQPMALGTVGKIRLVVAIIFLLAIFYILSRLLAKQTDTQNVNKITGKGSIIANDELVIQVPKLLKVSVFYEALCPDSRHYIEQQVTPTFTALKDIIELQLVPYGKATTRIQPDGTLKFNCQHGPKECSANKVHACVTNRVKDASLSLKYIHCMIDINFQNIDPLAAGERCIPAEYWSAVQKCSTTEQGDAILHHMGKLTHDLNPKVTFIPTVTVDGSQNQQNMLYRNLQSTLCSMYDGAKPPACS